MTAAMRLCAYPMTSFAAVCDYSRQLLKGVINYAKMEKLVRKWASM